MGHYMGILYEPSKVLAGYIWLLVATLTVDDTAHTVQS